MIQIPQNISFRDDPFVEWDFYISMDFIRHHQNKIDEWVKVLNAFYDDYIDISQKYNIGEIIPLPFLEKYNIDLKQVYKQLNEEFMILNDHVALFPLGNIHRTTLSKDFSRLLPCANKYTLLSREGCLVSDYFVFSQKNVATKIKHTQYKKIPNDGWNFVFECRGEEIPLDDDSDIGFTISIHSEFWFQKVFFGKDISWENADDNSFLAYHNAPRLNSYLRDLKDIWINKYGWSFEKEMGWYNLNNEDGILLDGKVIYQEDNDNN